jgi:putative nucleotidyltransferase with HDIG domain
MAAPAGRRIQAPPAENQLLQVRLGIASSLFMSLRCRHAATAAHSLRVTLGCASWAVVLGMSDEQRDIIEVAALLHDIGKIGVPEQILHKPGPLDEPEWRVMRAHSRLGAKMIGEIPFLQGPGVEVIRSHHERWDGRGYPDRMGGEEIPLGARIFAVADALDAITNHRPYREARSWRVARLEIIAQAGKQFDPQVVEAFRDREHVLHEIRCEFLVAA